MRGTESGGAGAHRVHAFSLPSTAFTRQVNRATAETAQADGLAPLMGKAIAAGDLAVV